MKKFKKVLSMAAISMLLVGGLTACDKNKPTTTSETPTSETPVPSTSVSTSATDDLEALLKAAANLISVKYNHNKITDDFDVVASVKYKGVVYPVVWHSNDEKLLTFESKPAEGGLEAECKAVLHRPAPDAEKEYTTVSFYATIEKDGKSATSEEFDVRIKRQQSQKQIFDEYYEADDGVSASFEGYIIAKVGYVENYKEGNVIVYNPEAGGSYFVYNAYIDKAVYDALEGGEFCKVANAVKSTYNGLVETKYGATITVDTTHEKLDLSQIAIKDISTDIISGNASGVEFLKKQSSFVKATNFEVKAINTFSATAGKYGTTMQTLVTLERCGEQLNVVLYEGITPFADKATKTLYNSLKDKIKVGNYVDVTGLLTYNAGNAIAIDSADDVVVSAKGATAYDKAYDDLTEQVGKFVPFYNKETTVTLPATGTNGSALTYEIKEGTNVTINNGVLTIAAGEKEGKAKLVITSKSGDAQYSEEVTITSQAISDEEVAKKVADSLTLDYTKDPAAIVLPTKEKTYGTTFAWELVNGDGVAEIVDGKLLVLPTTAAKEVTVKVTVTKNDKTSTKEIKVAVPTYSLTSYTSDSKSDYSKFENTKFYYVEGYITKALDSYGNTYISSTLGGDAKIQIWGMYDVAGTKYDKFGFELPVGTKVVLYGEYVGTDKYNEIKNAVLVSYEINEDLAAQNLLDAAKKSFAASYDSNKEITLAKGVTAVVTAGTSATVADGKVTITPTETEETVTLTLSATYGQTTKTAEVTFKTKKAAPAPVGEATKAELKYTESANYNCKNDGDITTKLTTDTNITINSQKNNYKDGPALYTDSIRLYNASENNGCELVIAAKEGLSITKVVINYDLTKTGGVLSVNGTALSAVAKTRTSDTVEFTTETKSVSVKNTGGSQVRIASIEVYYA